MFVISLFYYLLDTEPERFDQQTKGVVVSCVDCTDRSRKALENGGPVLDYLIEAQYQVYDVTYTHKEHWGSPKQVGSIVTITYNSAKPSDSTMIEDPAAGNARVGMLSIISGVVLLVTLFPLVTGKGRKPKEKPAKPEG